MRVVKVLNNSVVLALDDNGAEVILMGKGIGFRRTAGSVLSVADTDKVFVLRDRTVTRNLVRLTLDVDADVFAVAKEIIDYAKSRYQMELMDHIYLALTDHLAFAIRRVRENIDVPTFYSQSVRNFNPAEYDVGQYALRRIREEMGVEIPEGEVSNIAFHFINARKQYALNDENRKMSSMVQGALDIVRRTFHIEYNQETVAYSRFLTHLHAMVQRILKGQQLQDDLSDFLYDEIAPSCPEELKCAEKIGRFLQSIVQTAITRQEKLYLTVHIHRVLEEQR